MQLKTIIRWSVGFLSIIVLQTTMFAQVQLEIRQQIVPLVSSRSDVERIARKVEERWDVTEDDTAFGRLEVSYSTADKCVEHGWDVPSDRVIFYYLIPKKDISRNDVEAAFKDLIPMGSDDGSVTLISREKGIEFYFRSGDYEKVDRIRFTPTALNKSLRCNGFPEYDPVAEHYSPYQVSYVKGSADEWDVNTIFAGIARVTDEPNLRGFAFVYCLKGKEKVCTEVQKKIERVSKRVLKSARDSFTVSSGGYRDGIEVELILVSSKGPFPQPRPKYPK